MLAKDLRENFFLKKKEKKQPDLGDIIPSYTISAAP